MTPHPIDLCTLEESERIWREIAATRGMTLEEFDKRCGVITPVLPPAPRLTPRARPGAGGKG